MQATESKPVILANASQTVGIGVVVSFGPKNLLGRTKLKGNLNASTVAALVRVLQSRDGVTTDLVMGVGQDPTQAGFQYPIDLEIVLPYVTVEFTGGAAQATLRSFIQAF